MQDLQTGHLHPINERQHAALAALAAEESSAIAETLEGEKARDLAELRPKTWPVFKLNEIVELKGGRFRISHIGKRKLVLRGVPSDV